MSNAPPPVAEESGEVWSDVHAGNATPVTGLPGQPGPVVGTGPLVGRKTTRHVSRMQLRVLYGVGGFFLLTLVAIVAGPATGAIREEFAAQIMQTILPPLLASGATIVGTLFTSERSE